MVVSEETANKIKEVQKNYNYPGAATLIKLMRGSLSRHWKR
jgi:hypothetical protein